MENNEFLENFNSKNFEFSYSSIKLLMFNPSSFYNKYCLNEDENKDSESLRYGKLVHCMLTTPQDFDNLYTVSNEELPTVNLKKLIDKIFLFHTSEVSDNLEDYSTLILSTLEELNLYQSLKDTTVKGEIITGDSKRLSKVLDDKVINYWNNLVRNKGKTVISQEWYDSTVELANRINNSDILKNILNIDKEDTFNEILLHSSSLNNKFLLKGYIDNLNFDHETKTINIVDIKTTGKSIHDFEETVEYYSYWLQCVIYIQLVSNNYRHLKQKGYSITFTFLVIDKYNMIYTFKVSNETIQKWKIRYQKEIEPLVLYHLQLKEFELPYKFATNQVIL